DSSVDLSDEREVEAAKLSRSFSSSKSQTSTDRTLNVSETSFAAAAQRLESSVALEVEWVNRVQISRKSYWGRLKCWLTKRFTRCRSRSESRRTARTAIPKRMRNACN